MKKAFLIGNPNVGKTAVLNILSGSSFSVGNWAGVTVSRQEGVLNLSSGKIHLLDLPGLYSLSPCSQDEGISAQEIFSHDADVFLNIIDVNNLHQNIMLSAELGELGVPVIGLLNFYDEFSQSQELDIQALEEALGYPLIAFSARTGQGVEQLKTLLDETKDFSVWKSKHRIVTQPAYQKLPEIFLQASERYGFAHFASKLDPVAVLSQLSVKNPTVMQKLHLTEKDIDVVLLSHGNDIPDFIQDIIDKKEYVVQSAKVVLKPGKKSKSSQARAADSILLHPIIGMVSFFTIMLILFTMVFNLANPFIDFIDWLVGEKFAAYASEFLGDTHPAFQSFIVDGLIGGIGSILTFVPLIFILYIFLAVLEESGYLARIAVLLEYPLSKIGLSGKAFFPMMLGFGCNVPAIYGARVLETPELRRLTALLAPLMSCGARLTVFALFVSAFFRGNASLILMSMYLIGIVIAVVLSYVFSRFTLFSSDNSCFVMVLPPYRVPNSTVVFRNAAKHAGSYIQKAGGIILGLLMVIWALSYFPNDGDIHESYLAKAGRVIQPVFVPLGFGERWEPVVSIIPSLIAKEAVVGFLGQVLVAEDSENEGELQAQFLLGEELHEIGREFFATIRKAAVGFFTWNVADLFAPPDEEELEAEGGAGIVNRLRNIWGDDPLAPVKAYSFMLFILLTVPCVACIGALKQELDRKSFWITLALYVFLPYVVALCYYQIARFVS